MQRLEGKVALVTGAGAGIGRAICARLAKEGATVLVSDLAASAQEDPAIIGARAYYQLDVTSGEAWEDVTRTILARHSRVDLLVNNAGYLGRTSEDDFLAMPIEEWRKVYSVNVEGALLGTRCMIKIMEECGSGAIVNIGSISSVRASPYASAYASSKAALLSLTKSTAQFCAERGNAIRCNAVDPGVVHTPLWEEFAVASAEQRGVSLDDIVQETAARTPLGRMVQAGDVAAAVAFLASDDAAAITGTTIAVDAGSTGCDTFYLSERYRSALAPLPLPR